jgi:ABC-type multidrug transport system fused ATPase/permease subunit
MSKKIHKYLWLSRAYNLGLSYRVIATLIALSLAATITEIFGIGIFLPIFQFIRLEGDVNALIEGSRFWKYIINWFSYFDMRPSLAVLLLISFGFFLGRQVFVYFRLIYNEAVTQRMVQMQRNRIFDSYMDADTSYHDSVPVGNLLSVIVTEVNGAVSGVMAPLTLIVYIVMLLGYLGVLSLLSWEMTLFSVVAIFLASVVPRVWIRQSAETGRKLVYSNTMMSEFLVGRLRSPRLVRLAGTEIAEKKEFHNLTLAQRKHMVFGSMLQSKTEVSMEPFILSLSFIFLYFAYSVLHLQVEVIGLYLVIAMRLIPVAKVIVLQIQSIKRMLGSIEVLENRFKEMEGAIEQDSGTKTLSQIKESILIKEVNYRYPGSKEDVLKNITIKFNVNEITAIVGPSGGGKSTLIDLLPRLRLPTSGDVYIDNKKIKNYKLNSLRQMISYAPQSPQIFDGSVKNHILYGKRNATNSEICEAARLAGAEEFINKLPKKFDTVLGEDAVKLSGGQRQRLDLARALVGKAEILILDEPNSNLDAESEKKFKKVLTRIREETNTTIIIVAHRLASISDADKIVVLSQGTVQDSGVHADLLEKGWYAKAWKIQSQHK